MLIPFIRLAAASALFLSTRAAGPRESLLVNAQWLADHLNDPKLVLLHIGDRATYDAGHIPRARFMTLADISVTDALGNNLQMPKPDELRERLAALGISDDSRVIVYYDGNRVSMATRVVFTLAHAGLGLNTSM